MRGQYLFPSAWQKNDTESIFIFLDNQNKTLFHSSNLRLVKVKISLVSPFSTPRVCHNSWSAYMHKVRIRCSIVFKREFMSLCSSYPVSTYNPRQDRHFLCEKRGILNGSYSLCESFLLKESNSPLICKMRGLVFEDFFEECFFVYLRSHSFESTKHGHDSTSSNITLI